MTDLTAAAVAAMVLSLVVFATAAAWYAAPRMRAMALGAAITPLLWIHAFRHVALQLFSAQAFGFAIPDHTRDQIVYGDLIGMGLALATLYALRYRWRLAIPLAWAFVVATVLDLSNAAVMGIREHLFDKAADVSWLILTFYVPALWVSVVLVAWRLWTRRGERRVPEGSGRPELRGGAEVAQGGGGVAVIKLTQVIRRPVEDVFRTVADTGNFASWNPTIKSSRPLSRGAAGNGSQAEWELRGLGTVRQELQEFEPNRRVRIVPHVRSIAGGHRFTFTDLGAETRVDHELEMTPRGVYKVMGPMIRMTGWRNLRATAGALQRHLERG